MKKLSIFAVLILVAAAAFAQESEPTAVTVDTSEGQLDVNITVRVVSDSAQQDQYSPAAQQQQNVPAQQQQAAPVQQYTPAPQQAGPAQQQAGQQYAALSPDDVDTIATAVAEAIVTAEAEAEAAAPNQPWPRSQFFAIELGFAAPIHFNQSGYVKPLDGEDWDGSDDFTQDNVLNDKKPSFNIATNIAVLYNFGSLLAFTIDADLFYNTSVYGTSSEKMVSTTLFGTNILVAPAFTFYNGSRSRAAFALGFHLYYSDETYYFVTNPTADPIEDKTIQVTDLQLGLGGYIGFQQHISESVYFFGRLNFSLDHFRWTTSTAGDRSVTTADVDGHLDADAPAQGFLVLNGSLKPVFGLGIKF